MSRDVLITGSSILLGSYLAATCLISSEGRVFVDAPRGGEELPPEELADLIGRAAVRIAPEREARDVGELISARLRLLPDGPRHGVPGRHYPLPVNVEAVEVWCLDAGAGFAGRFGRPAGAVRDLLTALRELRAAEFNYVRMACGSGASDGRVTEESGSVRGFAGDRPSGIERGLERKVVERCEALNIGRRIFRTSLVFDETLPLARAGGEGFFQFLAALHSLKGEIEGRHPEYFEYQALRCQAPADAMLNLVRAEDAAELMLRIARDPETSGGCFYIANPEGVRFDGLCERVGEAYEVSLLPVVALEELNAIDLLFHERLAGFHACLTPPGEDSDGRHAYRTADFAPGLAPFGAEEQLALLRAVRDKQDVARAARDVRVAGVVGALERRVIDRGGSGLTYYAGGSGAPAVVLLNAVGQGLYYWHGLIERLMRRRRVITWEPRGLDNAPRPFRLGDHVDDLEAILKEEGVDTCHLVGWCTGPKVAVEFHLRHPEVAASLVFLNCSFKHPGSPPELDTAYERNLESLCRVLDRRPETAGSMMKALRSQVIDADPERLDETDAARLAADMLSMMSLNLREHVLSPFRTEETLSNYSRQLLDFMAYDATAGARRVRAPVLLVSSEYDKVASPDMSSMAAEHFPAARHVQVRGASHYCLYDRPELLADLIETFFQNPEGVEGVGGEVRLMHRGRGR